MNRGDKGEEVVVSEIVRVFPSVETHGSLTAMSHAECVEMRTGIMALRPEYVPYYLPQIMVDLINTHQLDSDRDSIDFIRVLDVGGYENAKMDALRRSLSKNAEMLKEAKGELFALVNREQALVISKWLNVSFEWNELKIYRDVVRAVQSSWYLRGTDEGH